MAMGKAIVSTSIGCEGLGVTDGENILTADTPQDFADTVVKALMDSDLRKRLEDNARRFAQQQDWEYIYKIQEQIYQEVVRR